MPSSIILSAMGYKAAEIATMYVARFAINFAISMIVARVFATGPSEQTDNGVRQQVPPATTNSLPIVYGDAYLGGTFVDAVLSVDQKTMYYVLAISSISPNGQFSFDRTKMYWSDKTITFDSTDLTKVVSLTDGAGNVDTKINGNLYINLYTSTDAGVITSANGAALPSVVMGGSDIASAQRWTGTRQMNGLAFAIIKLNYSQDAGTTQMQPVTFHVSQYLYGAGCAKPGDVWYDYITNVIYGGAMDASLVNSTSRTTLNTYSDELITFTNSSGVPSTQARYRINGVLDTGNSVLSNIDSILIGCDSWNQYNAASGQWTVVVNKAETTSFAFDDSNIIGEIKVSVQDISASINQVEATFPSKLNRDQKDVVFIETPSGLLYPNEPINKYSISFDLVNDSVQANYLANRLLEQAREDLIVTITAAYPAIQVDAGDVVSITNSAYGWSGKLFRVMKVSEISTGDGTLGASLDLSEYSASVYDNQDITQYSPLPNSGLVSSLYFSALAAPTVSANRPTQTIPTFDIDIVTPTIGRVTGITLFYTTETSPTITDWKQLASYTTANSQPISQGTTFKFENLSLPKETYYFSFVVWNETTQSQQSATSLAFHWGLFDSISAPTVVNQLPNAPIPSFDMECTLPAGVGSGTVGSVTLFYSTGGDWNVWGIQKPTDANPYPFSTVVTFTAISLPTDVYTFAFQVQNNVGISDISPSSVSLNWNPNPSSSSTFISSFSPSTLQVQYTTSPILTGIVPMLYGSNYLGAVPFVTSQTDSDAAFVNNTWRIGASSTTGNTDIVKTYLTIGDPSSVSGHAQWPTPTVMSADNASLNVPIRMKNNLGTVIQASTSNLQLVFSYQGASSCVMYARIASNPIPVSGTVTVTGDNRPTGTESSAVWGASFNVTWYDTDPLPSSNYSLYQADGIYDGINTVWSTPYISSLKVGSLSAITANVGVLTVANPGSIATIGRSYGSTTVAGFFLGYDSTTYKFDVGNSDGSKYLKFDGSNVSIKGDLYSNGAAVFTGSNPTSLAFTTAILANDTYAASIGLLAYSKNTGTAFGVVGQTDSTAGIGVEGFSSTSGGIGVIAYNNASGTALNVDGKMTITNNTLVSNLNADMVDGLNATDLIQRTSGVVFSGTSTATFYTANKPGSNGTNGWIAITISGTTYYIPAWT